MIALSPEPRPSIWLPPEYRSSFGVDPDTGAAVFGGGTVRNPAGVKITPETALRASVYLACVRVLCETMASLPLYLYRLTPNGKQKAKDHPYYKLFLRRPNGWQTAWEWKQLMMLHLCTYGEAFNEKVLSSSSESLVTELVPLAPSRIKDVVETEAGSLRYTFRTDTGKDVPYGQDQVNHFRWLTDDGIRGLVPTELAEDAIGLARACEIHGAAFFGNGARPGLVLKTPHETIDQATRDEIRFTWMREHGGPRKAHRPAVLTGGLEPAIVDGNNQESQFLETRRFQAEECCRILGVPPHMVGILDRATFSNIEQQGIGYYQQTVLGWAERIEAALTRDVLGEEMADEYELAFDVSRILRGDAAARMTYYHTGLTDGIFSVNEVREQEGMNSVEGGDQRFVGLNMQTLQQAAAASAASVPPPAETASPAGEPAAAPAANEPAQVADVSLNGAQINGLIAILQQVTAGVIAKEGAAAIISAAFPSISRQQIDAILAGVVEASSPQAAPPAQPPQASGGAPAPAGLPDDGQQRRDCGTGAGGFQPGNKCAGGGDGGGGDGDSGGSGGSSGSGSVGSESGQVSHEEAQRVFRGASAKAMSPESGGDPEQIKERAVFKKQVETIMLDRLRANSSEDDVSDDLLKAMRFDKPEYTDGAAAGEERRTALARGMVDQWASTSGDTDPPAVAVQKAIAAELSYDVPDVKNAELGHLGQYGRLRMPPEDILKARQTEKLVAESDAVRQVIRAQYDATQQYFKDQGITEITIHRGFLSPNLKESDDAEFKLQPASSFSLNRETAVAFADGLKAPYAGVATVTVPVSRILSTPMTGFGCLSEQEIVVIGGTVRGKLKTGGKK